MESLSSRVDHERLFQKCFIDYDREMALVADGLNPQSGEREILGVARLTKTMGERDAEVAVLVSDAKQGQGIGTELLGRLIEVARGEKLERVIANILPENLAMRSLANRFAFSATPSEEDSDMLVGVLTL
jgi:acetyltransferase